MTRGGAIRRYWAYAVAVACIGAGVALLAKRVEGPVPLRQRLAYRIAPNDKIRLAGSRRLLVADSLGADWPGQQHDAVTAPNVRAEYITEYASGYAHAGRYDEVVVWVGTDHLIHGYDTAALLEDIRGFAENLGGTAYVILGPVPPRGASPELRTTFADVNARLGAAYPRAFVDVAAALALDGEGARFRRDDTRLIPEAYARLQAIVDALLLAGAEPQEELRAAVSWGQHNPSPDRGQEAAPPSVVAGPGPR